jgi:DNA (cytosine-5)-methyltransferase 1
MAQIDYPAHLDAMWQKAIAPRQPNAPTVISTFAGGGGSLTGYMMAGFNDLLAVEWDDNAVQTLRLNWPTLDIYHGDIAKLSVEEVLRRTGLQPGELDILDGSPPCQGFSTAGKRIMDDPRNQLFTEYVRLLRGLRPKVFVMENVSGMVKGKMKLVFVDILKELKTSGYLVSAKLLNAKYFHVPQSRERMIFIGVRDDLGIEPSHPKAESGMVTVGNAFESIGAMDETTATAWGTNPNWAVSKYIPRIKQGMGCDSVHPKKAGFNLVRLSPDRPSPTIPKTCNGSLFAGLLPPVGNRYCTIEEIKRLGAFPDGYFFGGEFGDKWQRIGNSVPPLFMEAIARHIRAEVLEKAT